MRQNPTETVSRLLRRHRLEKQHQTQPHTGELFAYLVHRLPLAGCELPLFYNPIHQCPRPARQPGPKNHRSFGPLHTMEARYGATLGLGRRPWGHLIPPGRQSLRRHGRELHRQEHRRAPGAHRVAPGGDTSAGACGHVRESCLLKTTGIRARMGNTVFSKLFHTDTN